MLDHFYESVDGFFNFREIYEQAVRELDDGAVIVEVGSWYGRSAAFLAVEIERSRKAIELYCVDTWKGSVDTPWMAQQLGGGSALPKFLENLQRGGVRHRVQVVEKPSVEAAAGFDRESIDLVLIDASHDYASVREDVRAWYPRVKQNGILAGDDADWPGVLIGVHETIADSEVVLHNGKANWWHRKARPVRGSWSHRHPEPRADVFAYIPYVNRPDLLHRAIASVRSLWPSLVIVDQSPEGLPREFWEALPGAPEALAGIFRAPPGSMSFTQLMNWARAEALERGSRQVVFMHNDAELIDPAVAEQSLARARAHPRTGLAFTNYDAFCVFNTAALEDIGPWDETFRWYFSDNDYYRRLRLRGWQVAELGGENVRHHTSQTLRSDAEIRRSVDETWRWHTAHYAHKWGGPPGEETYALPYNGRAW